MPFVSQKWLFKCKYNIIIHIHQLTCHPNSNDEGFCRTQADRGRRRGGVNHPEPQVLEEVSSEGESSEPGGFIASADP